MSKKRKWTSKSDRKEKIIHHALRRANERFNLNLTRKDLEEMIGIIQSNAPTLVKKDSYRHSQHRLIYQGKIFNVIYDRKKQMIKTFLYPKDMSKETREGLVERIKELEQ